MDEMNNTMVDEVIENTVENVAEVTHDFKNVGYVAGGIALGAAALYGMYRAGKAVAPKIAEGVENFKNRKQKATDEAEVETVTVVESDVVDQK